VEEVVELVPKPQLQLQEVKRGEISTLNDSR
jgi:hypothetical protein